MGHGGTIGRVGGVFGAGPTGCRSESCARSGDKGGGGVGAHLGPESSPTGPGGGGEGSEGMQAHD